MMKFRSAGGVAALKNYIYALGGHDGYLYLLALILFESKQLPFIVFRLSIFDSCERYDPIENTWTKVAPMLERRCRLGVASLNGRIYACGGYDGNSFLKRLESEKMESFKWKKVLN